MTEVSIRHEFPSSVHIAVTDPKSERSAVGLARNFASKHYGVRVAHYVSSGYSEGAYTYVYSNPSYVDPETGIDLTPLPLNPPAAVTPDKPLKLTSTTIRPAPPQAPGLNARQRRAQRRSGGAFAAHYYA